MKNKIRNVTALIFVTFLFFATLETLFRPANAASADARESSTSEVLDVPKTGSPANLKTAEVYETLIEIAFLTATGLGFYLITGRKNI